MRSACRFSDDDRVKIKAHVEGVMARRKAPCSVDFDELWNALELAAMAYDDAAGGGAGACETRAELMKYRSIIDDLVKNCLQKPELFKFDFVSATGIFSKSERKPPPSLINELTAERDKFDEVIADLKKFIDDGGKIHSVSKDDYRINVQGLILELGRNLFGSSVGNEKGPLVTFLELALRPILGQETPTPQALKKFAQREWGGQQGQK